MALELDYPLLQHGKRLVAFIRWSTPTRDQENLLLAEASYHMVLLEEMNEEVFEKNCRMIYLVFINQGYDYKYSIKGQGAG